jgi:hypothetical protein
VKKTLRGKRHIRAARSVAIGRNRKSLKKTARFAKQIKLLSEFISTIDFNAMARIIAETIAQAKLLIIEEMQRNELQKTTH